MWAKNLQWAQLTPNKARCLWPKTKAGPRNNGASFARCIYGRMVIMPKELWHQKDTAHYLLPLLHRKSDWVNIQINPMFLYFTYPNVGTLSTYKQLRWLHSSGRIKRQFTSNKPLHRLNGYHSDSWMKTFFLLPCKQLWCLEKYTYLSFFRDMFTFCFSLLTFKVPLYVPSFVKCRSIYICAVYGSGYFCTYCLYILWFGSLNIFYCTLHVDDTG